MYFKISVVVLHPLALAGCSLDATRKDCSTHRAENQHEEGQKRFSSQHETKKNIETEIKYYDKHFGLCESDRLIHFMNAP